MDTFTNTAIIATSKDLTYPLGRDWAPAPGQIHQVAKGVYWLHMPLMRPFLRINLWLLEDGNGWTVVDTGMDTPEARSHWAAVETQHLCGRPIKRVIATHMHPDHIGLAGWLTRRHDCELSVTRDEYLMCRSLATDSTKSVSNSALSFYRAAGLDEDALHDYGKRFSEFGAMTSPLPDSFHRLVDNQTIEINGRDWQVIIGSGHSPAHACLYCPTLELMITGDQVLPRISSNVSVHPAEPYEDPLTEWLQSCHKLSGLLPNTTLLLPAHEEPFYGLHTRTSQLITSGENTLDQLYHFLEEPKRAIDCFPALFKRKICPETLILAIGETLAFMNCLIKRGMVIRERNEEGVDFYRQQACANLSITF